MKAKVLNQNKKSVNSSQKVSTTAHLIETTAHQLAHTYRHFKAAKKAKTPTARKFDMEHAERHLDGAVEHVQKLMTHVASNYPSEAKELKMLENTVTHSRQPDPKTKATIKGIADALKK